jgi:methionyl-tRNA formyltransferase
MIKKEDGLLDFHQPAIELERRVRAYHPWPGAYMFWQGQNLKILSANVIEERASQPGQTLAWGSSPAIGTGQGLLVLEEVQPAGKKAISGKAFLAGARGWI